MKKGNLLVSCILVLLCFPVAHVFAQNGSSAANNINVSKQVDQRRLTNVELFIKSVSETNKFVEVSNIWQADNNFDQTDLLKNVDKVQPLTIDYTAVASLIQKNTTAISLVVPGINGGTYTIDLAQFSCLPNDFEVHTKAGDVETNFDYTPGKYYSGVVRGIPGSLAAFSFFKNEVYGIFSIPNVGNLVLVPNKMTGPRYNYNQHYILYNDFDIIHKELAPKCGTDQLDPSYLHDPNRTSRTTTTLNNNIYFNGCTEVNVMDLGDYAFYQSEGSNVVNATNYLTALFNNEAVIYRNEGVIANLKYVQINTASDVYQTLANSSSAFLNAFGDDIQNTYKTAHGCNVAMLATTRYGSMGGVAWLTAMCANYSASSHYDATAISNIDNSAVLSFPTYSWDVEVLTHETGHNLGSHHTHGCVWNPQWTGTTAIDGCYTLEGSCAMPVPALPPGGGTIMSYCHLTAVGINFTNGFGPQPGIVIRNFINGTSPASYGNPPVGCAPEYKPSVALATANRTINANRECTDMTGITYYWKDNNTADQSDDTLVLMIKKNGNTFGDLNTAGFTVSANTVVRYGTGTGDTISFPAGTSPSILSQNYSMRRYWKVTPTSTPATAVEVIFPFLSTDTIDVHGSLQPALAPLSSYLAYKANSPVDPNPVNNFPGATSSSFSIYSYAATPSTTNWSLSTTGTTQFAHMQMTNLAGGGSLFYTSCPQLPAPVGAAVANPCPASVYTYSVAPVAGAASYVWTVSGTGWSGASTTNSINLTAGTGIATITVGAVAACGGTGNLYTFNITPSPLPVETISTTTPLCTGLTSVGLFANATAGSPTSYTWTVTGTGWSGSGTTSSITATAGVGTGTVTVTGTNACGTGTPATLLVTMNAVAPVAPTSITPPALACPSSTAIFTTPGSPGATSYSWTVAGTGWSGASSTASINVNVGTGVGTLTVNAVNACGASPAYVGNFNTSTGPGASTSISGPSDPCSGTTVTFTTPSVPTASSYVWTVSGIGWSGSSSTNSINVVVGTGVGTISVRPVNACGTGSPYTLSAINPLAAPTATFALSSHIVNVHSTVNIIYTGVAPTGSTYSWNFSGGFATPGTGSGPQTVYWNTPGQYLVFLTVSNGAGCSAAYADTVDVLNGTGIQNVNIQNIDASIIPNPNNGTFDILFSESVTQPISIKLYDMLGRVAYSNDFANAVNKKLPIETNNLPAGTYTVTIYVDQSAITKKVTIYK